MPHQGAAGDHKVRSRGIERLIDKEIFLLPSEVGIYLRDRLVEEAADRGGRIRNGLEGLFERGFVVQGLTGVGDEDGRDAEGVIDDKHRGSRIPGRVASGLECGADASVGERGCVRFLLGEGLSVKSLYDSTLAVILDQRVVLLGGALCQRLEPVGHVGHVMLHSPLFHTLCDSVSGLPVKGLSVVDAVKERVQGLGVQVLVHFGTVKDQFSVVVGGLALRALSRNCLLLEGFLHQIKSVNAHNLSIC